MMQRYIEADGLLLGADAQAQRYIDQLENRERSSKGDGYADARAEELQQELKERG